MIVMVFGVFDRLHEGHKAFLKSAASYGDLVVVVARDISVKRLKNKLPEWHELKRKEMIEALFPGVRAVLGDEAQGSYEVIKSCHPDLICLGYDQEFLKKDLEEKMLAGVIATIPRATLKPYLPEQYKTSHYV